MSLRSPRAIQEVLEGGKHEVAIKERTLQEGWKNVPEAVLFNEVGNRMDEGNLRAAIDRLDDFPPNETYPKPARKKGLHQMA